MARVDLTTLSRHELLELRRELTRERMRISAELHEVARWFEETAEHERAPAQGLFG